jgi:PAS domain S-box-containing protein
MSVSSGITGMGLKRLVAQMPAAVMVVEAPSGRIVHVNARAREMTERQLGRPIPPDLTPHWGMFHPDGRPYAMDEWPPVRSITTGEEVAGEEYFNVLADGSRMTVRCSSSPIYDNDRRIVAGVLVMTDVTEQKLQEEHLTYLAGLLDNTEDAIVASDSAWLVTMWNKGAERLYGWTADEVLGRHTLDVAHLEMSYEERAEVRRAAAEDGRWRGDVVAYRKDGTPVCVELIAVGLRAQGGEITGYLGIHRDMTERRGAKEALGEAQRRSETILENISDAFVAMDRDWRFTYLNERALAQTRKARGPAVTAEALLGKSLWELAPSLVGTKIDAEFHRALRDQTVVEFEAYSPPAERWVEILVYPSEDGVSVYSHDISARKSAQEEMRRRAEQQAVVAELGRRALASDDLQALLDEAAGLVAGTLDVELVAVAEMVRGGEAIVFRAGFGWGEGVVGRIDQVGLDSLMAYTLALGEPVIVDDMATDGRFRASSVARDHGLIGALSVMIESPDEPFGTLGALSTRRRTFSRSEVSFVQAVANVLASAVERRRAQERLIEVREVERRRIARDLHDEALQDMTHALPVADELLRFAGRRQEQERRQREAIARLTPREREVLQALGDGLDSQQIADRMRISVRTERNHVASVLTKLGVHSQLQAVLFALRYGVIELP